jgi:predicted PurR-regulated permease PerM
MDPILIGGMVFSLVVLILVGSFVLLFPLSRQLASLVRKRLQEPWPGNAMTREDAEKLAQAIQQLATGMEALNERQDFLEQLLEGRSPAQDKLPPGSDDPPA